MDFYHATDPDSACAILASAFENRCQSGKVGRPGVWLSSLPAITGIPVDQFLGHVDEAWLQISLPRELVGDPIPDPSWPFEQWLVDASTANSGMIQQITFQQVIQIRRQYDPSFLCRLLDALDETRPQYDWLTDREAQVMAPRYFSRWLETVSDRRDLYLTRLRQVADCCNEQEIQTLIMPRVATVIG